MRRIKNPSAGLATASPWRAGGFTLMELLIVSVMVVIFTAMTAQMWRYFLRQADDLSTRARAAQELRLGLESLSADMGGVIWAVPAGEQRLQIYGLPPGSPGNVILEYYLNGQRLMRSESTSGEAVTIADNVSDFQVADITPSVLQVTLAVTAGTVTRRATLFWSRP